MQLTTVGQELWKGARKAEQLREAGADNPTVQERLRKLKLVKALRKRKVGWSEIKELVGISRATYYRWQRRLKEEGLKGLAPKPRRPRHLRQKVCWTPELLAQIEALRKQNPTWGRWPIWLALRKQNRQVQTQAQGQSQAQGQTQAQTQAQTQGQAQAQTQAQTQGQDQSQGCPISERTVGRILAYLEAHGRIESVASFLARARRGQLRRRKRRPYARRKPRAYRVNHPGDLVQIDTLTVTLGPGEMVRHFSAVDLHSRFSLAEVHTRATAHLAAGFLSELLAGLSSLPTPFPIRAIQVDGGSEFMAE